LGDCFTRKKRSFAVTPLFWLNNYERSSQ